MRSRYLLPLLLSALAAGCGIAPAPPAAPPAAALAEPLGDDTAAVQGVLPNGLRYYLRENDEPRNRAELRLVVRAGSILEDDDQRGLAHFVEHMAFNGTERFEKQALVDYLEAIGMRFGPDVNAYTSFDETVYMLTLPTDSAGVLETGFEILEDWARGITFDSLEVEKERGVVIEEWRLGQGAASRLQRVQFPALMRDSRYADRLPIGDRESLATFDHEALKRFYRDWYRPDLMAVVAVGDFDAGRVETLIRERFGDLPAPPDPRPRPDYGVPDHDRTIVSVATDAEATATNVSLYLKTPPRAWTTVGSFRDWLVESLASGMVTNRLSERTHDPGSPFLDVSSFQGRFVHPLAVYMLSVRVPEGGVERGLEELVREVERVDRHGFTATELDREKRDLLRRLEQRYLERGTTTSSTFAAEYVADFVYGGTVMGIEREYELTEALLPRIDVAEVDRVARGWLGERNRVVLVSAPRSDSVSIPTEAELEAVVRAAGDAPLAAYADSLSAAPLLADPPAGGRVAEARAVPAVGATVWTLDNGVRVVLRPTDFRADEILLAGRSPGGTSLVDDEDFLAARTASALVQVGGVGALSTVELRKRLAGTTVGVGTDIGEQSEGVSGGGSPRDLETLLQLVYLKFTAPRLDSAAIEAYRTQARSTIANRAVSPEQVFFDTLRATLSRHHPRTRPLTAADFDSLDVRRSFEFYRDRFADASDFTFYLVGNFDPAEIRPLVERYLGGLPSLRREERGRDLGIRPPEGVVRRVVRRGMEPKAATQIVFTGPLEYRRENLWGLRALAEVLQLRLREALREDRGGTYGVRVHAGASDDPWSRYQVSVGFGADPGRVEELTGVVFAVIDSVQAYGPRPEEVHKVREMELRERETDVRTNHFWMQQLVAYDENGWALDGIHDYPAWIASSLDPALVREAAIRYLNGGRYVQVSLLPAAEPAPAGEASGGTELP